MHPEMLRRVEAVEPKATGLGTNSPSPEDWIMPHANLALAEKAPNENYREHHMKQAKDASTVSAEKTRQANEIRARGA